MKLAVVQTAPEFGRVSENVGAALALMESVPADLYVLPELFTSGYNFESVGEAGQYAESLDGPTTQAMIRFCRSKKCHVCFGFAERDVVLYNSAALVGPGGLAGHYRKIHLYNRETLFFAPGNIGFPVFDIPGAKVGIIVCFDWFFPESIRTLALQGAEIILHPANLVLPYCPDAMVTRSIENRVFTATADRVGREDRAGTDLGFIGTSQITTPGGKILCRLGREHEEIDVCDINAADARNKSINPYNNLFSDRKTEFYSKK